MVQLRGNRKANHMLRSTWVRWEGGKSRGVELWNSYGLNVVGST